jgi:uncharacterized protein YcfL
MSTASARPFATADHRPIRRRAARTLGAAGLTALGLLAAAPLSGCESPPGVAATDPIPTADPRLSVLDPVGRALLRFQPPVVVDRDPNPLRVQVPVTNVSDRDTYYADYRFIFFDVDGLQLEPVMGWEFVPFDPGQSQRMIGTAVNPRATTWRLEVRRAR